MYIRSCFAAFRVWLLSLGVMCSELERLPLSERRTKSGWTVSCFGHHVLIPEGDVWSLCILLLWVFVFRCCMGGCFRFSLVEGLGPWLLTVCPTVPVPCQICTSQ